MNPQPADAQLWLIPFIVVAFTIMFTSIWCFVCILLATVSGYRSLVAKYLIDDQVFAGMEALPTPLYAMIGVTSYRGGLLAIRADRTGLALRVSKFFPFHPPIRIPWSQVGRAESSVVLDGRVTLRAPGDALAAIEHARARFGGQAQSTSGWG